MQETLRRDGSNMEPRLLIREIAKSPSPRLRRVSFRDWQYDVVAWNYLPVPPDDLSADVFRVLSERRSRRKFDAVSSDKLANLLWYTSKTRQTETLGGSRWEHRSTPSAGGCHPIDVLVAPWPTDHETLYYYDPVSHALCELCVASAADLRLATEQAIVATSAKGSGLIIWHVAQFRRTFAKYHLGASLVQRDAGALVGVTCIAAEALGLACCAVGISGEPFLSRALGSRSYAVGLGGCVVGELPATAD